MKIDTYTKVVLTVIAIGVGLLAFDQKPVKDAQAGPVERNYMIGVVQKSTHAWHMDGDKVRSCWFIWVKAARG